MAAVNQSVGNDGSDKLRCNHDADLIYRFDPDGPTAIAPATAITCHRRTDRKDCVSIGSQ